MLSQTSQIQIHLIACGTRSLRHCFLSHTSTVFIHSVTKKHPPQNCFLVLIFVHLLWVLNEFSLFPFVLVAYQSKAYVIPHLHVI